MSTGSSSRTGLNTSLIRMLYNANNAFVSDLSTTTGIATANAILLNAAAGSVVAERAIIVNTDRDISSFRNLTSEKLISTDTTDSTSPITGAVTITGGLGVDKNLYIGGTTEITNAGNAILNIRADTNGSDTTETPSINLYKNADAISSTIGIGSSDDTFFSNAQDTEFVFQANGSNICQIRTTGTVIQPTTTSTSTATGALIVKGGVGVNDNINAGGTIGVDVSGLTATDPTFRNSDDTFIVNAEGMVDSKHTIIIQHGLKFYGYNTVPNPLAGECRIYQKADGHLWYKSDLVADTNISGGAEYFTGVNPGTVTASKAIIVDGSSDITGFNNVTASGSFIIGSADLNEVDMIRLNSLINYAVSQGWIS
jgi:hypothetical protein